MAIQVLAYTSGGVCAEDGAGVGGVLVPGVEDSNRQLLRAGKSLRGDGKEKANV